MLLFVQEREAAEAQAEMERRMEEARTKEEESRRLQEELRRAHEEMEEKQRALHEAISTPRALHVSEHDDDDDEDESARSHSMHCANFNGHLDGTLFILFYIMDCLVLTCIIITKTTHIAKLPKSKAILTTLACQRGLEDANIKNPLGW